jgi:U3 small nucleolar ribonucleoprotein protein IMP4
MTACLSDSILFLTRSNIFFLPLNTRVISIYFSIVFPTSVPVSEHMLRRNVRLRKEYLYRKSLESTDSAEFEKRKAIKDALAEGKRIPAHLRDESERLKHDMEIDDPTSTQLRTHIDDEYQNVGVYDPKIMITSSRDPSTRLMQFIKETRLCFPNAQRMNRGNTVTSELVEMCRSNDFTDLIIIHEHRGEPDGLIISHFPYGPTAYFGISNAVLRHDLNVDLGTVSEAAPHLIFHNFSSKLGLRTQNILKALFPVPKEDSRRIMTFVNRDDTISFRHHVYKKNGVKERMEDGKPEIELAEVGPRFELKLYQVKLGTVDMKEAETEWVLRPYMNTAKKRKAL